MITNYSELYKQSQNLLKSVTDTPDLEARWLIEDTFLFDHAQFLLNLRTLINTDKLALFYERVNKRLTGCPLAYILGYTWFLGQKYQLESGVLIPRPETELLVLEAVKRLKTLKPKAKFKVIEIGFGSGIISIELAKRYPHAEIHSWDISEKAYILAKKNSKNHNTENIHWYHKDFFTDQKIWGTWFDNGDIVLLISNPPYITDFDYKKLDMQVKDFEPKEALVAGKKGLDVYENIQKVLSNVKYWPMLMFEFGIDQKDDLVKLFATGEKTPEVILDHQNHPRILIV